MLQLLTSVVASDTLQTVTKQWMHHSSMNKRQNTGEQTPLPILVKVKESALDIGVRCGSQRVIIIFWCLFSAHLCPSRKISIVCYCLSRWMFLLHYMYDSKKYWRYKVKYIFCVYMYSCLWISFCWIIAIICIYQWIFHSSFADTCTKECNCLDFLLNIWFCHLSILQILCLERSERNVMAAPHLKWCSGVIMCVTDTLCGIFLRYKSVICWRSKGFFVFINFIFLMDVPYFYKIYYCVSLIVFN